MDLDIAQVALDGQQKDVAHIEIQERQVVAAGPGTGKTQVLAELAAELAYSYTGYEDSTEDLDISQDVLVISFSRAAVDAMRKRTNKDKTLRGLRIQTIDSLAGQVLAQYGVPTAGKSFDDRITAASELLRKNEPEFIRVLRHVIIDEAQDVVGVRAEFITEILKRLNEHAGFTVLGDINQAIFDFQINGGIQDDDRFIQKCRLLSGARGKPLTKQYRAQGEVPRAAMAMRKHLICDPDRDLSTMKEFVEGLESVGSIETLGADVLGYSGSTLVLADTNAVAWRIEQALRNQGVHATRRSGVQELGYAPWIGHLFASSLGPSEREITWAQFSRRAHELPENLSEDIIKELWSSLRQGLGVRGEAISTKKLHQFISQRRLSFEFLASDPTQVVVSTVHRAKGLEFDNVILMGAESWGPKSEKGRGKMTGAERLGLARALYVACTRATHELKRGERVAVRGAWKADGYLVDGPCKSPRAIEIFPSDFEFLGIESGLAHELGDLGTTYKFALNTGASQHRGYPVIDMFIHQERIARSNESLGRRLARFQGRLASVGSLKLFGFETQAVALDSPYYNYGVGVVPRISGLLPLTWSK